MKSFRFAWLIALLALTCLRSYAEAPLLNPKQVWADYDPNLGDFKEEIVKQETKGGFYYRESYISAYVLGEEVRVYCLYKVKEGAQKAPGLLNVHGWMGAASIPKDYVDEGWAVMSYDYCGQTGTRQHSTKYPEKLRHGEMSGGRVIGSSLPDRTAITDPKQTSDYLWYAIESRVLSYLEQQKEVDKTRLGAVGYSYGGTLMWYLGMDPRIKAIVSYFGIGYTEYYRSRGVMMYAIPSVTPEKTSGEKIFLAGVAPEAHVPYITAPTLFLNGSNDHHGVCERGLETFKVFPKNVPWAFAMQVRGHHNTEKVGQDAKMWLEKYVLGKDVFWPQNPQSKIRLDADGVPELLVEPADPQRVKSVEMYYALKNPTWISRAWRDAVVVRHGDTWTAKLPVIDIDDYVFSYANVIYDTTAVVSTEFNAAIPATLGAAKATDTASAVLYDGAGGGAAWTNVAEVEGAGGIKGFRCIDNQKGFSNEQLNDPKWKAPATAELSFRFYCTEPQTLILTAGDYAGEIEMTASDEWQEVVVDREKLVNRHDPKRTLPHWDNVGSVRFNPKPTADITKVLFSQFQWVVK
ncbi:MAG: prolyl oligopeptidase family serine peptidase [Planctomycetia bacterium]|nr:prolyl oligopeptidase family serine peptidase [Planctomycetia bacterium]